MDINSNDLQLMNLADAALILQVSKRTLLRMIQQKVVPALKVGGQWRLRQSQLRTWLYEREKETLEGRKE